MLLLVREDGTLRFFTHAATPEPRPGDTIISFVPPKSQEEQASKRAAREGAKGDVAKPGTLPETNPRTQ